jgi:hypothetical protein
MSRVGTVVLMSGVALVAWGCGGGSSGGGAAGTSAAGSTGSAGAIGSAGTTGDACTTDFTPCGGDLVGAWQTDLRCVNAHLALPGGGCQGQTFDTSKVLAQGTWTFGADLTTTFSYSVAGTVTATAPDACVVSTAGAPIACTNAAAGAMYATRIVFPGGKPGAPTCEETSGTCTCTIPFVADPMSGGGTYSTSGTTLTVSFGTAGSPVDYCVSGSTLKMRSQTGNGAANVSVYQRQ